MGVSHTPTVRAGWKNLLGTKWIEKNNGAVSFTLAAPDWNYLMAFIADLARS